MHIRDIKDEIVSRGDEIIDDLGFDPDHGISHRGDVTYMLLARIIAGQEEIVKRLDSLLESSETARRARKLGGQF